jgi:hypothetical protein
MKGKIALSLIVFLALPLLTYGQIMETTADKTTFPVTEWISKDATDPVTIQNGAGTPILIVIHVTSPGANGPGVNVKNCGTTTTIKAGSTTICDTSDAANPVTLTSDSSSLSATGTYQIKQK